MTSLLNNNSSCLLEIKFIIISFMKINHLLVLRLFQKVVKCHFETGTVPRFCTSRLPVTMLVSRVQMEWWNFSSSSFSCACRAVRGRPCAAAATDSSPYAGRGWRRSQQGDSFCRNSGLSISCSLGSWNRTHLPIIKRQRLGIWWHVNCKMPVLVQFDPLGSFSFPQAGKQV